MKRLKLFCGLILFLIQLQVSASDTTVVKSPDGNIAFRLFEKNHQFYFSVRLFNRYMIAPSPMDVSVSGISVTKNTVVKKTERYHKNDSYAILGVHSMAVNSFNGIIIYTTAGGGALRCTLDIRVFNDGVGFRHSVISEMSTLVPEEKTIFNLPAKSRLWYHDLYMHYEGAHVNKKIDSVSDGEWVAPPSTFKLPQGYYGSITEAALLDYPGMALQSNGKNGLVLRLANDQPTSYPYKLRYSADDTVRLRKPAEIRGRVTTPWRVIIIGKDLNTIVNNDIITNLNPPPDPKLFPKGIATDWIKPGRAVWKYLNGGGDGTPEVMKHFTDGAAALGFEHNILEGFWTRWTDEQLKDLVDYSRQKGVGIWVWKHSKSLRNASCETHSFASAMRLELPAQRLISSTARPKK